MRFTGSFGNWLKVRRHALDLTQLELADQVGCAVVTIRKFERNIARPSKQIAERLADVLVLSPEERAPFIAFARHMTEFAPAPLRDQQTLDSRRQEPTFATPFIGRADEIREMAALLGDPYCRLLTLSGPGGIGKTRLAIQVTSAKATDFPDGVYFVALAPLTAPDQIIPAIANTVGLLLRNGESLQQQLISYLHGKRCLLLLDNFEHLLEGVSLVTHLLDGTTAPKFLITSREALNLQEEWIRPIKGMPLPSEDVVENIEGYGAIQLFVDRASRVRGDFSLRDEQVQVIRIGRLVEGMPLAIELAASWLRTMTCAQIADAIQRDVDFLSTPLRNVPDRHRSIRAVFERSWALLTIDERAVFRKLSVFRGGFTPEAAQQVAATSLRTLALLTDKSLLQLSPQGRYALHELLHQYGAEQLELAGETESVQQSHAQYYADFMARLAASLKGRELPIALNKIKADWDNVRVACSWIIAHRDFDLFDRLLESLRLYGGEYRILEIQEIWRQALAQFAPRPGEAARLTWGRLLSNSTEVHGLVAAFDGDSAHERIARALKIAQDHANPVEIGRSLAGRGLLFHLQADEHEALQWYQSALAHFQQVNDRFCMADMYHCIGMTQAVLGQLEASLQSYRQQLEICRAIGYQAGIAWALLRMSESYLNLGNAPQAEQALEEAHRIHQKLGNMIGLSICADIFAYMALLRGHFEQAKVDLETAWNMANEAGSQFERQTALVLNGVLLCLLGNPEQARHMIDGATQDFELSIRNARYYWGLSLITCAIGDIEAAQKYTAGHQKLGLALHGVLNLVSSLPAQAIILARQGLLDRAVELLGLAVAYPVGITGWMLKWSPLTQLCADLERELGADVYRAAWERGAALDLETTVAAFLAH